MHSKACSFLATEVANFQPHTVNSGSGYGCTAKYHALHNVILLSSHLITCPNILLRFSFEISDTICTFSCLVQGRLPWSAFARLGQTWAAWPGLENLGQPGKPRPAWSVLATPGEPWPTWPGLARLGQAWPASASLASLSQPGQAQPGLASLGQLGQAWPAWPTLANLGQPGHANHQI